MKNIILSITFLISLHLTAQELPVSNPLDLDTKIGRGLNFNFNEGNYFFKIGGMVQPYVGIQKDSTSNNKYFMNSRRNYLNFSGRAKNEKIAFLFQTDFSLSSPLLDAWVSYTPINNLKFTVGQVQTFANNKEMTIMENQLQFINRSLVSEQFSATGREFGLFVELKFNLGKIGIVPQAAVTSGDGRNSFGTTPTDYDLGGLKYAGRLNVFPFGFFSEGNNTQIADIKVEQKPKIAFGASGSYNVGVSDSTFGVGEGHGSFFLYDKLGKNKLPDYRKVSFDLHFKFKGFSLLTEYILATAKVTAGTYFDATAVNALKATQISQFLSLGNGYNVQTGYIYKKKYGIDFRYSSVTAEFSENINSILKKRNEWTVGLTKYVDENNLKYGASFSQIDIGTSKTIVGAFTVQAAF
ncbi:MAG: hypothetical protein ACEQSR_06430 [Candidatus Methylacidiphilales bacterium]